MYSSVSLVTALNEAGFVIECISSLAFVQLLYVQSYNCKINSRSCIHLHKPLAILQNMDLHRLLIINNLIIAFCFKTVVVYIIHYKADIDEPHYLTWFCKSNKSGHSSPWPL